MNKISENEIEAIRKRAEKATEGPWWASEGLYVVNNLTGDSYEWDADFVAETERESDAEFIAHAREDIPKLLAEINRLKSELSKYSQSEFENMCEDWYALSVGEYSDKGVEITKREHVGRRDWYDYYAVRFNYCGKKYAFAYRKHISPNVCDIEITEGIREMKGDTFE